MTDQSEDQLSALVIALGTHFLTDGSPCFCPRWDAIYPESHEVIHQPRCRMARMALGYSGEARTVGCAASDDECKGFALGGHPAPEWDCRDSMEVGRQWCRVHDASWPHGTPTVTGCVEWLRLHARLTSPEPD